jgi:putative transferase (TIGR04331 family)
MRHQLCRCALWKRHGFSRLGDGCYPWNSIRTEFVEVNKEKRFLITTALEETWDDDQPVLFLGEWCRLYSRKDRWSEMNAALLPFHWDDRDKLFSDYQYLDSLYERILGDMVIKLNQIHNVEYNTRYWRILVGPWLAYFIQMLFDRWLSIQSAINLFEITGTIVLTGNEEQLIPNDMMHFAKLMLGDEWNHYVYAEILYKLGNVRIIVKNSGQGYNSPKHGKDKVSIRHRALRIYSGISNYFAKDSDAFLSSTYLKKTNEMLLHLRLGQLPQFWQGIKPVQVTLDRQHRNWEMPRQGNSDFEFFLLSMLPKQIPKVYLEGYQLLNQQIQKLPWPKSPKLIYTSNVLWYDSVSMAYTAKKVEQGTQLVYGQHGGVYGVAKFFFSEEHEVKISDRYLTWGWCSESNTAVVPIGIVSVKKKILRDFNYNKNLLLITLNSPRYTFRLSSESGLNFPRYFENYFSFSSLLHDCIRKNMLVRLHSIDYGWEQPLRWRARFPKVKLDLGLRMIYDLMKESRIVVHTYNSTGIMETLALGIPSVLFIDLKVTPLRETAVPYYAELKRVGIFHDTPESAAAHVNAIWDNVDAWWTSYEVQEVVANFSKQYCHLPENILDSVENVLRDVIAE